VPAAVSASSRSPKAILVTIGASAVAAVASVVVSEMVSRRVSRDRRPAAADSQQVAAKAPPVAPSSAASSVARAESAGATAPPTTAAKADTIVSGVTVYAATCVTCHQATGQGLADKYPPLAGSEWVTGGEERMIRVILGGLTGEIEVEGEVFSGLMPPWGPSLSDHEIAAVATYVRSQWGNAAPAVSAVTVGRIRAATASRTTPWTAAELRRIPP
jgi:mono/diheme cytochrome c family protein